MDLFKFYLSKQKCRAKFILNQNLDCFVYFSCKFNIVVKISLIYCIVWWLSWNCQKKDIACLSFYKQSFTFLFKLASLWVICWKFYQHSLRLYIISNNWLKKLIIRYIHQGWTRLLYSFPPPQVCKDTDYTNAWMSKQSPL